MFFPIKADLDLQKIPFFSIIICILCVAIYVAQEASYKETTSEITKFCNENQDLSFKLALKSMYGGSENSACESLFYSFFEKGDAQSKIDVLIDESKKLAGFSKTDSKNYVKNIIDNKVWAFNLLRLSDLTTEMLYYPDSYDLGDMFRSSIAHADWSHLIGNLIFFFAFAATVELMLGVGRYFLLLAFLAIGTGLSYSLVSLGNPDALPTLGLSGVVMGMIGVFAYLMPKVNIKCFIWIIIFVRVIRIPAWILATWYIGWDLYGVFSSSDTSNTNFVAHISGAFIGALFGIVFLRKEKKAFARDGEY